MLNPDLLNEIVRILVREASPEKIILFGSHARGNANPDSDIDLLIVERSLKSKRAEMVRLDKALSPLKLPFDVLVTDEAQLTSSWADFPGTYLYDALREGKMLYAVDRTSPAIAS